MNLYIPLSNRDPIFEQVVTLEEIDYTLRFLWNGRVGCWYCQVEDQGGLILAAYRKITVDRPWIPHDTTDGLPPGLLWFFTRDGGGIDPGLTDLGEKVQLAYISSENVTG